MEIKIGFRKAYDLGSGLNFPDCFFAIGDKNFIYDALAKTDLFKDQKGLINLVPYSSIGVFNSDPPDNKPIPCPPIVVEINFKIWAWEQGNLIDLLFEKIQAANPFFADAEIVTVEIPDEMLI